MELEPVSEALSLLKRKAQIAVDMEGTGQRVEANIRGLRELAWIHARLRSYPQAVRTVLNAIYNLERPVDSITVADVEQWSGTAEH